MEKPCPFQRYATIREQDYQKFIRLEAKVLASKAGSEDGRKALSKAAQYISSIMVCPECGLLRFPDPVEDRVTYYRRETD